jgi:D-serine dehydratase
LHAYPEADVFLFVDSPALIRAFGAEWRSNPKLPGLNLLVEVGCGRGGANTQAEVEELVEACGALDDRRIRLAGIAAYEGTVNRLDAAEMRVLFDDLFTRLQSALAAVRRAVGAEQPLLLSAGGSMLFDMVIARGLPMVRTDGGAQLLLRSGSCYYGDHGAMPERFAAIVSRNLLGDEASQRIASFRPALRLWAEVLSVHGRVAICGLGLRDASHDQGLPIPLRLWRDGHLIGALSSHAVLTKFNDQHAFVDASDANLEVGDVVEFGVRHPCTTIDSTTLSMALDPMAESGKCSGPSSDSRL